MPDQQTLNLDQILDKDTLVKLLKYAGLTEAQIAEDYQQIENNFKINCLELAFQSLPPETRQELTPPVGNPNDPIQAENFLRKVNDFLTQNPKLVQPELIIPKAIKQTYEDYLQNLKKKLTQIKYGNS